MTFITISVSGRWATIEAKGHATGSVQACAAISTVMYGIAGYLKNSRIRVKEVRLEPGDSTITFSILGFAGKNLLKMARIALGQIRDSAIGYVAVREILK